MTTYNPKIEAIKAEIGEIKEAITVKQKEIDQFDMSEYVSDEQYSNWLDEVHDEVVIGNLTYLPSQVLREVDPIAYRCGFTDYVDSLNPSDDENYQILEEELEELENDLLDVEERLDELENEIEDEEG